MVDLISEGYQKYAESIHVFDVRSLQNKDAISIYCRCGWSTELGTLELVYQGEGYIRTALTGIRERHLRVAEQMAREIEGTWTPGFEIKLPGWCCAVGTL